MAKLFGKTLWNDADTDRLILLCQNGARLKEIYAAFPERSASSCRQRISYLQLEIPTVTITLPAKAFKKLKAFAQSHGDKPEAVAAAIVAAVACDDLFRAVLDWDRSDDDPATPEPPMPLPVVIGSALNRPELMGALASFDIASAQAVITGGKA